MRVSVRISLCLAAACSGDDVVDNPDAAVPHLPAAMSVVSTNAMTSDGATATFYFLGGPTCAPTTIGSCQVSCNSSAASYVSAGTASIAGATQPVSLDPRTEGFYYVVFDSALFLGGETLNFAADGASVPAFSRSLEAPQRATITMPQRQSSQTLVAQRNADLVVSWSGVSSGTVEVDLQNPDTRVFAHCDFPASDGTGNVPAALLAQLPPCASGDVCYFGVTSNARDHVIAGDWDVVINAAHVSVWPDELPANAHLVLE